MDKNRTLESINISLHKLVSNEDKKKLKKYKREQMEAGGTYAIRSGEKANSEKTSSKTENVQKLKPPPVTSSRPVPTDFKIKSGENSRSYTFTLSTCGSNDIRIAPQPIKYENYSNQVTAQPLNIKPLILAPLERKRGTF
jgi:hypothetical protein